MMSPSASGKFSKEAVNMKLAIYYRNICLLGSVGNAQMVLKLPGYGLKFWWRASIFILITVMLV